MSASPEDITSHIGREGLRPRPPWAIAEWAFVGRCDGCLACVDACRDGVLGPGRDGRPEVDFRFGSCDFCGACVAACDRGALRRDLASRTAAFRFVLTVDTACLALAGEPCRTCEEFCDAYAIRFRPTEQGTMVPTVVAANCNGCGACVGPCPVGSIHLTRPAIPRRG